jgi:hypothetical protein
MIFSRETLRDSFTLLAMLWSCTSGLLIYSYSVDETGLQLICSSRNQKLLAVKGSKWFAVLLKEKRVKPWQ